MAAAYSPEHQLSIDASRDIAKQTWDRDIVPVPITLDEAGQDVDVPLTIEQNITFSPNRPALVQFTLGTTGSPKGRHAGPGILQPPGGGILRLSDE